MLQSAYDLLAGFEVALTPHNLLWVFIGVLVGNLIGVLPGLGALSAISILLPLTYSLTPVPAILMLSGIYYGSMYGGAIGAILLNLPSHPPHAVACLDGYPLTQQGKGGVALGITMLASFFAASCGIVVMIFLSPLLVNAANQLGPPELFSIMLLGLCCGATMSKGSMLSGVAMALLGLLIGAAGTDVNSGVARFTFGFDELSDKVELVALALGLFGVADFLCSVNNVSSVGSPMKIGFRDMLPSLSDLKKSFAPMLRGTSVGLLFGAMPGTGPTITTFVAYALEKRVSKTPARFGRGAIEGVASPEAASHSKTQVDFIPTMSLGIPGDAVMALVLGALLIQGIQPGPQLITEHADLFWGLVASFWIGNVMLMVLNVPLIGIWVSMLKLPYKYMYPAALFFIGIGVFSTNNSAFEVGEVLVFGVMGAVLIKMKFPVAPILLGYVLGPMLEENFRRSLVIARGDITVFFTQPISLIVLMICAGVVILQLSFGMKKSRASQH